jgi:hypothetical protein
VRIRQAPAGIDTVLMSAVLFIQHFFLAVLKKSIVYIVDAFIYTLFLAFYGTVTISTNRFRKIMKKLAIILAAIWNPTRIHSFDFKMKIKIKKILQACVKPS